MKEIIFMTFCIKDNIKMVKEMVMEYNYLEMVQNIQEIGRKIKPMDLVDQNI